MINFIRNNNSKALLCKDIQEKEKYKKRVQKMNEHEKVKKDIADIKLEMAKIQKNLLELTITLSGGKAFDYYA